MDQRSHGANDEGAQILVDRLSALPEDILVQLLSLFLAHARSHRWVRFATKCDVQELFISLSIDPSYSPKLGKTSLYTLPQHTFSCSSVTNLELRTCNVEPNGLINWKSLKNLWLRFSLVTDDIIHSILLGSPLLEFLELESCRGFKHLDIDSTSLRKLIINGYWWLYGPEKDYILEILAPNLKSLEITGELKRRRCRLVNMFSLVDANLSFYSTMSDKDGEAYQIMFKELIESLNHVKELTLGYSFIPVMSRLELKYRPSLSMHKWLRLSTFVSRMDSPGIEDLLQSSLDLETLIIDIPSSFNSGWFGRASVANSHDLEKYWTSRERIIFPCLGRHLKAIKIVGFNGLDLKRVLPFVEFLLKNARVLEKMVIRTRNFGGKHSCCASKELLDVARKLLVCPRSSRNAVVLFT